MTRHADLRLVEIAERHHLLVTRAQVRRAGMSSSQWSARLDDGLWRPAAPGVWRHRLTADDWRLRARAAQLCLGTDAALFGRTAAAWWDLLPPPEHVEMVVPRARRHLGPPFVLHTSTRWSPRGIVPRDGVRVPTATTLVFQLAAGTGNRSVAVREVESVIDDALRRRLTSLPNLQRAFTDLGGRGTRGTALLKLLLLDSGGESYLERRFLGLVRRAGLPRPLCQVVHRAGKRTIARVDFQFAGTRVVVEVSGRLGHVTDRDRQKDARRRNALQADGWIVLEFTTADVVEDPAYVIRTIRDQLVMPSPAPAR
jgi:hypothetical protein